jgi:nucleoside-diphosphate-sugar epimerase
MNELSCDAVQPPGRSLVTGATGLLGSHIAERLVGAGVAVRALVRPTSQTDFLESLGVQLVRGDLTSAEDVARALDGVTTVYHAASKVGDWGSWADFERDCLGATRTLANAAVRADVRRFVHISSTSAYGHPREGGPPILEDDALGQNLWPLWDHYTRSKVEQERLLWRMAEGAGLRLTVIRPSWLFGERDRTTTARLVRRLQGRGIPLVGSGDNPLSAIHAGEVAEAAVRASDLPIALNRAYNVTDQGPITQRSFFNLWASACGVRPSRSRHAYGLVFAVGLGLEAASRLTRRPRPPVITRYATWLMARRVSYSTARARYELGWSPSQTYDESIRKTVSWYLNQTASLSESNEVRASRLAGR